MSVNININPVSNEAKWASLANGSFAIIEQTTDHPIPSGLYRIFVVNIRQASGVKEFIVIPMFEGPFNPDMFPYMITENPPTIRQLVHKVNIDVEVEINL